MITGRSQRTREQLNISSIRKTAQHKTEGRPRLLLPGKAHAFRAFTHLFPVTLPASRHNVKPEGWPQPDRVDDEEKSIPGLHRTTGFNITFPSCPPWGGPGHSPPALPGLGIGAAPLHGQLLHRSGKLAGVCGLPQRGARRSGCCWQSTVTNLGMTKGPRVISNMSPTNQCHLSKLMG